jgi:hypothetical protein
VEVGLSMPKNHWPLVTLDVMIEVAVRVGAVEQAPGNVVNAHVQPRALAGAAESARAAAIAPSVTSQ